MATEAMTDRYQASVYLICFNALSISVPHLIPDSHLNMSGSWDALQNACSEYLKAETT